MNLFLRNYSSQQEPCVKKKLLRVSVVKASVKLPWKTSHGELLTIFKTSQKRTPPLVFFMEFSEFFFLTTIFKLRSDQQLIKLEEFLETDFMQGYWKTLKM